MGTEDRAYMGADYATGSVADATIAVRAQFLRKTYSHLFGAIALFVGLEVLLFQLPNLQAFALWPFRGGINGLIYMLGYIFFSNVAERQAQSATKVSTQYAWLGFYVLLETAFFLPVLYWASLRGGDIIPTAGVMTLTVFGVLTMLVVFTKKDFEFLGPAIRLAMISALILIALAIILPLFGIPFHLGGFFAGFMVVVAAAIILYQTSNVLHRYESSQHVAASLALFASVALLFWYLLQLVQSGDD
ncbi:MAG: Bax inhibitor-1 family protein [Planctomycetota bacterium]